MPDQPGHPVDLSKPTQPSIDWTLLAKMALETGMLNTVPTNPVPVQPDFSVRVTPADGVRPEATPWTNAGIRLAGGVLGGLAGSLLGPVGTAAGAALGTTLASNEVAQPREVAQGTREGVNPLAGYAEGASTMLPIARLQGLRSLPAVVGSAAGGSAVGSGAVQLAEAGTIDPKRALQETVMGTAFGTAIPVAIRGVQALPGAAQRVSMMPAVQKLALDETGAIGPREPHVLTQQPDGRPGGGAKPPIVSADPRVINQKTWYHGTGTPNLSTATVHADLTNPLGLFGPGFYMTDDPAIALDYGKSRGKFSSPLVYTGRVNVERVLDLTTPAPPDVRASLQAIINKHSGLAEPTQVPAGWPTERIIAALKEDLDPYATDIDSVMYDLHDSLAGLGYQAVTHLGGVRAGGGKRQHQVLILLGRGKEKLAQLYPEPVAFGPHQDVPMPTLPTERTGDILRPHAATGALPPVSSAVDGGELPAPALMQTPSGEAPTSPDAQWSRIAGEKLPAAARGVIDPVPVPESMTPAGLAPSAIQANIARTKRFFDRHNVSDDLKQQAAEILTSGDDYLFQKQRRSGQTWEQIDALASQIIPEIRLPKGSVVSPEEMGALRRSAFGLLEKAKDVSEDVAGLSRIEAQVAANMPEGVAGRQELLDKYGVSDLGQLRLLEKQAVEEAVAAQRSLMGVRSEFGRGLNYLKSLQNARSMGDADFLAAALKGGAVPEDAMAALRQMPDAMGRYKFLRGLAKPNAQDYWRWYAMTAYLSGPVTQWRNLMGNAANFGVEAVLVNPLAAGIDRVRNPNNRQVTLNETSASAAGLSSGFLDGVGKALFYFKNGFTTDDVAGHVELPPEVFGGALAPNVVGRTMGAVDQFFRTVGFHMELHRQATTQAVKEGLQGEALAARVKALVDDPTVTPELHKRALRYATELTYQESNRGVLTEPVVTGAKRIMRGLDAGTQHAADFAWEHGLQKLGKMGSATYGVMSFPPSVIVAPFINTPFNILKRAAQYVGGSAMVVKGGDREAMLNAARGAVGMATLGAAAGLYQQGLITGAAPTDRAEADAFYATKRPYSIRVGDEWVSYQALGPLGAVLGSLANYMQAAERNPRDWAGKFGQLVGSTGKMVVDSSFLKGMYNLLDAVANAERAGDKWAARTATGLLPAAGAMRFVRDQIDPTLRNPEGLREQVMAALPGLSQQVPARVDFVGQEIQRPSTIAPTPAKSDPLREELLRLKLSTGEGYLRAPESAADALLRKINTKRKTYRLAPLKSIPQELRESYAKAYGQRSAKVLSGVIGTDLYRSLDDSDKKAIVERFKDRITKQVDEEFLQRYVAQAQR